MVKIVEIIDTSSDTIAVAFSNGSIVMLNMELLMQTLPFDALREDDRIRYPHIEDGGAAIYWQNGPRMTVEEIVRFLEDSNN